MRADNPEAWTVVIIMFGLCIVIPICLAAVQIWGSP